eukprot:6109612-Amphidinium_carterae.2
MLVSAPALPNKTKQFGWKAQCVKGVSPDMHIQRVTHAQVCVNASHVRFAAVSAHTPTPPPARRQHRHDIAEKVPSDLIDDYDETRSTTRASASGSTSLKRKITEETLETKKKQAAIINHFYHVITNNFHSASASSTEGLKYSTTSATPRAPKTSTP